MTVRNPLRSLEFVWKQNLQFLFNRCRNKLSQSTPTWLKGSPLWGGFSSQHNTENQHPVSRLSGDPSDHEEDGETTGTWQTVSKLSYLSCVFLKTHSFLKAAAYSSHRNLLALLPSIWRWTQKPQVLTTAFSDSCLPPSSLPVDHVTWSIT